MYVLQKLFMSTSNAIDFGFLFVPRFVPLILMVACYREGVVLSGMSCSFRVRHIMKKQ